MQCTYHILHKYIFHDFTPFAIFLMARCLFDLNTYVHVNIKIQTFKIIILMFQNIWNIFLCLPENLVLYNIHIYYSVSFCLHQMFFSNKFYDKCFAKRHFRKDCKYIEHTILFWFLVQWTKIYNILVLNCTNSIILVVNRWVLESE